MALSYPRPTPFDPAGVRELRRQFTGWAAETFASADFPHREMKALRQAGLLAVTLPGEPLDERRGNMASLLQLLKIVGEGNLSVGRIYEGHVNALHLIELFGTDAQKQRWFADARAGHLFGVWNTQMHDGVHLDRSEGGAVVMRGSKTFCSGALHVTRPIVPGVLHGADGRELGWQMTVVPLDHHDPPVDKSFWTPLGMRNSVSYKIDFTGIALGAHELLGSPEDYNRQPHLSGGAVRFAAVQLGGAEALLAATRDYLREAGRTEDGHQRARVGRLAILVESGNLWLTRAGHLSDQGGQAGEIVNYANMVRTVIADYCTQSLQLAEQCVGARGLMHPLPFARLHTDLSMYLRQPAPDATLEAVGKHYLDDPLAD